MVYSLQCVFLLGGWGWKLVMSHGWMGRALVPAIFDLDAAVLDLDVQALVPAVLDLDVQGSGPPCSGLGCLGLWS